MDITQQIGALSGSSSNSYPDPIPPAPPVAPVQSVQSGQSAGSVSAQPAFSPAVASAPSPSPEAILASSKGLPANVRYAPSPAPSDGVTHFDRKA